MTHAIGSATTRSRELDLAIKAAAVATTVAAMTAVSVVDWMRIPLPFTPVPITLQTLVVTASALAIGARLSSLSMAIYLLLGLVGYPVFSGAEGGAHIVFGDTGGYLLGFVVAPWVVNRFARADGKQPRLSAIVSGVLAGHLVIFALGLPVLWAALSASAGHLVTPADVLLQGLVPFLPGLIIKTLIASGFGAALVRCRSRMGW